MAYRNYYYFVATLPLINYGDKPPKSTKEFIEDCHSLLTKSDAAFIPYCTFDSKLAIQTTEPTGSAFIDEFLARERNLILSLANLRAVRLRRPEQEITENVDEVAQARAAFDMNDPLAATLYLDRQRWDALDDMIKMSDVFGLNHIFIHLLKLQLLERKQQFDNEKGYGLYREHYDEILDEYHSREQRG